MAGQVLANLNLFSKTAHHKAQKVHIDAFWCTKTRALRCHLKWMYHPLMLTFCRNAHSFSSTGIQSCNIQCDPCVVLFHCTTEPTGWYRRSITPHQLNSANTLILTLWGQTSAPSIAQWLLKLMRYVPYHIAKGVYSLSLQNMSLLVWV